MPSVFPSRFPLVLSICTVLTLGLSIGNAQIATPPTDHAVNVLQPFVDNHSIAGAVVLVADRHKVLDLGAIGFADIDAKTPMDPNDEFWIASMSKAMTASAVMMLVDEGKVNLDDPVEKYLPEFKGQMLVDPKDPTHTPKAPIHPITVREILSHTSGLPFKSAVEKMPLDSRPLKDAVATYAKTPLVFQPGTDFLYANSGINTGGEIIETVSGMSYEDFMEQRLFTPLGMKDTTFWPNDEQVARLARSYQIDPKTSRLVALNITQLTYPLTDHTHRFPMPAGGLFSTAVDVSKFCQMILNKGVGPDGTRLLSEAAIKEMTTKQTAANVKTPYAFGLDVGLGHIVHNGAYNTSMRMDPKLGMVVVFMVQAAGKIPKEITPAYMKAAEALFKKEEGAQQ
jgi:CubicO group peptidase (beta-lactamase class C family)